MENLALMVLSVIIGRWCYDVLVGYVKKRSSSEFEYTCRRPTCYFKATGNVQNLVLQLADVHDKWHEEVDHAS